MVRHLSRDVMKSNTTNGVLMIIDSLLFYYVHVMDCAGSSITYHIYHLSLIMYHVSCIIINLSTSSSTPDVSEALGVGYRKGRHVADDLCITHRSSKPMGPLEAREPHFLFKPGLLYIEP